MTRESSNEYGPSGALLNGFDYDLQVWVKHGRVLPCGHAASMGPTCCNGRRYAGATLADAIQANNVATPAGPACGHSACSQNYIDTGETGCVCDANGEPLIDKPAAEVAAADWNRLDAAVRATDAAFDQYRAADLGHGVTAGASYRAQLYGCTDFDRIDACMRRAFAAGWQAKERS
jgi:hypothetical protein